MTNEITERYNSFVHQMWLNNCDERSAWSQPVYTKEQYIRENGAFLEETFYMGSIGNQVWKEGEYVDK